MNVSMGYRVEGRNNPTEQNKVFVQLRNTGISNPAKS